MPATLKPQPRPRTARQVRAEFTRKGVAIAQWARDNDLSPTVVYQLLDGTKKAVRGQSHRAAVLLGMKHGEIDTTAGEQAHS